MACLSDTNCLLRWSQPDHPQHAVAAAAIKALQQQGTLVYITPQNLIEFWNVATRPLDRNGFGLTPAEADTLVTRAESLFPMAPDTAAITPRGDIWSRLSASPACRSTTRGW